jgi:hypothetical protein
VRASGSQPSTMRSMNETEGHEDTAPPKVTKGHEETMKEAKEQVGEPNRLMRESRALERFGFYLPMVTSITDSEPMKFL